MTMKKRIGTYLGHGWKIDDMRNESAPFSFAFYSPDGDCYNDHDLAMSYCPYCDEDEPEWTPDWCDHSKELLKKERHAKILSKMLRAYIWSGGDFKDIAQV